ncbi:uncharacterized protein LOC130012238 [Patella vulgata]|uniref:uncharacterized protein LOC130012238 n=1 Tax=Patella vulgata TaxID=6465 RepID=UPI0024A969A6|nr:uncharacterized protein LOC130012238 [Patella vulgata]
MAGYPDLRDHPKYVEAISWCPQNEDQVMMAIRVFLDLCEVRNWFDVRTHHCREMNLVFLSGRSSKKGQTELILPTDIYSQISPADMKMYFSAIKLENVETNCLTLAVYNVDSTIVYYKMFSGLVPPENPEMSEQKRRDKFESFQRSRNDLSKYIQQFTDERQTHS